MKKQRTPTPNWKVPFDHNGNMLSRDPRNTPSTRSGAKVPDLREPEPFTATLKLVQAAHNRLWFRDGETGTRYCMFLAELTRALRRNHTSRLRFTGRWSYCRSGQNFSIRAEGPAGGTKVDCCPDGQLYIRWMTARDADADTDGFYISIHCGYPDAYYSQAVACPFCGTDLPEEELIWSPTTSPR